MGTQSTHAQSKLRNAPLSDADQGNLLFENDEGLFFLEVSPEDDFYGYILDEVVAEYKTPFQDVLIAESRTYGRMLVLDGAIQSAESDEALYHEVLVQPAMLVHPKPQDVLIIGGGEGATLREVLKHDSVRSVTMVDIDRESVELCRKHLVQWHQGAFDDPRTKLVIEDGRKFIEENEAAYDVIIVDIVDMLDNGPAQKLYTREFYECLRGRLTAKGIVAVQAMEFSHSMVAAHAAVARTLRTAFREVHTYRAHIPSFLSGWGFLVASDWFVPQSWKPEDYDREIAARLSGKNLQHVDGAFITGVFALCKDTRAKLNAPGPVLQDGVDYSNDD